MGLFGDILGGLFGGGNTTVTQSTETKSEVNVGVTTTLNVDTAPLAQAFEIWGAATVEGQDKMAAALTILAAGEAAQAKTAEANVKSALTFASEVWGQTSRAAALIAACVATYWLFFKKG